MTVPSYSGGSYRDDEQNLINAGFTRDEWEYKYLSLSKQYEERLIGGDQSEADAIDTIRKKVSAILDRKSK